jgi:hypothetical protein
MLKMNNKLGLTMMSWLLSEDSQFFLVLPFFFLGNLVLKFQFKLLEGFVQIEILHEKKWLDMFKFRFKSIFYPSLNTIWVFQNLCKALFLLLFNEETCFSDGLTQISVLLKLLLKLGFKRSLKSRNRMKFKLE